MLVLTTVGSTKFDQLAQCVLDSSVISALRNRGYDTLSLQCGNSNLGSGIKPPASGALEFTKDGLNITVWKFKPSLQNDYEKADLVISHAGSGTIVDVLRMGKPLIVVPNPTLLDNHQDELASSLSNMGHLRSTSVSELAQCIHDFDRKALVPFPAPDPSRFRDLLDEEMGF